LKIVLSILFFFAWLGFWGLFVYLCGLANTARFDRIKRNILRRQQEKQE